MTTRILTTALFLGLTGMTMAQGSFTPKAQFTVTLNDGTEVEWDGDLNLIQQGSDDTWSISTSTEYSADYDVSNIKSINIVPLEQRFSSYESPTYPDYYRSFSGYDSKESWNLANIHDPSVMRAEDGYYYMYQTDASFGNALSGYGHFFCRRSKDLVQWEFLGATMQTVPSWVPTKLNELREAMGVGESSYDLTDDENFGYWAPCVRKVENGLYRMYYCITCPGYIDGDGSWGERAFIGLMETSDPSDVDSWEDKGYVITNASDKGLNFYVTAYEDCYFKWNAIDPSYIITPEGEHWLIYGSWHSGIAAVEIDPETGKTLEELGDPWGDSDEDIAAYGKLIYTREAGNRWQGSEGPEIVYHDGYYYLFLAYDALEIPYNTRICRSEYVDGPYYDINGNNVTEGADTYPIATHPYKFDEGYGWVGISHCAVFDDGEGNWYFSSQGRLPANAYGDEYSNAIMQGQVRKIIWSEDGWPVVMPECYGKVPQTDIAEEDIVGDYELIIMTYSYGTQMTPVALTLNDGGTISCSSWNDGEEWTFDTETNILTIAGIEMQVMRETDWEVPTDSRTPTIIFAGYGTDGETYWGKRDTFNYIAGGEETTSFGETDCSTGWWSAFSSYYRIPSEGTLRLNFTNYTDGVDNWDNYLLVVTNDDTRDGLLYSEYFVLRADLYGWGSSYDSSNLTSSGFDWDTFTSSMNGATVDITIARSDSTVTAECKVTGSDGNVFTQTLTATCGDGTQVIRAFLTTEDGYVDNITSSLE